MARHVMEALVETCARVRLQRPGAHETNHQSITLPARQSLMHKNFQKLRCLRYSQGSVDLPIHENQG